MKQFSRREFLKWSALSLGGLALRPWTRLFNLPEFPQADRLGRVLSGNVSVKAKPDIDSAEIGILTEDTIVPWLHEVTGSRPLWHHQRFVDTGNGYVYSPNLQPVRNLPNNPVKSLPSLGGFWVEVSVPYVDLVLQNPPARSPWLKATSTPRLYYSQVMWVDQIKNETGVTWYRIREKYGTFGDVFWAPGEAFRMISPQELQPIHPEIGDKRVEVDLLQQTMSCYEGNAEVYFCTVSTGGKFDADGNPVDTWSTPVGKHSIWRKMVSVHMTGGTTGGGYDLPGIGWTVLFSGNGVAVHSTFWHNSYGVPRSHGCVNARPEDAQFIFRWTQPSVEYLTGDVTISGDGSTKVFVKEA